MNILLGLLFLTSNKVNPLNLSEEDRVLEVIFTLERGINNKDLSTVAGCFITPGKAKEEFKSFFKNIDKLSQYPLICIFNPRVKIKGRKADVEFEYYFIGLDKKERERFCVKGRIKLSLMKKVQKWRIKNCDFLIRGR